jgi:hypothetical protein
MKRTLQGPKVEEKVDVDTRNAGFLFFLAFQAQTEKQLAGPKVEDARRKGRRKRLPPTGQRKHPQR